MPIECFLQSMLGADAANSAQFHVTHGYGE